MLDRDGKNLQVTDGVASRGEKVAMEESEVTEALRHRWSDVNGFISESKAPNKHSWHAFTYLHQIILTLACISK